MSDIWLNTIRIFAIPVRHVLVSQCKDHE